jgi:hypothetical protein
MADVLAREGKTGAWIKRNDQEMGAYVDMLVLQEVWMTMSHLSVFGHDDQRMRGPT